MILAYFLVESFNFCVGNRDTNWLILKLIPTWRYRHCATNQHSKIHFVISLFVLTWRPVATTPRYKFRKFPYINHCLFLQLFFFNIYNTDFNIWMSILSLPVLMESVSFKLQDFIFQSSVYRLLKCHLIAKIHDFEV